LSSAIFWTSRGHRFVSSHPPPRHLPSFFFCRAYIGFGIPTARRFYRMQLTHALALSANHFVMQEKVPTSMHSVRLEPTKLILTGTRTTYQTTVDAHYSSTSTDPSSFFFVSFFSLALLFLSAYIKRPNAYTGSGSSLLPPVSTAALSFMNTLVARRLQLFLPSSTLYVASDCFAPINTHGLRSQQLLQDSFQFPTFCE